MPAVSEGAAPGTTSPFQRALAAIEGEFAIVFVSADRVEAACAELRREAGDWTQPDHVAGIRRLGPLVHRKTGPFTHPLVALLREVAVAAADWPILAGLLESRDPDVCAGVLEDALALVRAGGLAVGIETVRTFADLSEREQSPLGRPDLLARIAALLRAAPGSTDPVATFFGQAAQPALRRLAARLLDLPGAPPSADTAAAVLGGSAPALIPLLTYTRASHLDLVDLVSRAGATPEIAAPLAALEQDCGRTLAGDIVGELGWRKANLGLDVQRYVGVSVDDSLPFLLRPVEADVVSACTGVRRVFERIVAIGHGGARGGAAGEAGGDEVIQRFRAYNVQHAEVLADLLGTEPLTVEKVHGILARMDRITRDFFDLFAARSEECAALPGLYSSLKARIEAEMQGAVAGRPLSVELTRLVQMFEDPPSLGAVRTLHGLKRYLHQRGLALGFGLLESRAGTNRTVDVVIASPERVLGTQRRIEYVDFDSPAAGDRAPAVPYPVQVVVDGFVRQLLHGHASLPRVRVFCYGNEVHYFVYFKNHPVFIRVDYSPPLGGGMIDLAYYGVSKYELDAHPGMGLEGIQACFRQLDFHAEVENTRIKARYDKERARDLTDLCDKVEALFRLVPYLMDVDWTIGSLELPESARGAVGEAWADLFARWGTLPISSLLTDDRTGILLARELRPEGLQEVRWSGRGPYADITTGRPRPAFLVEVHDLLTARGVELPRVEDERRVGQMLLEARLLRPVRDAMARGELVRGRDGLCPAPPERFERHHEADRLAMVLASDDDTVVRSARLARLASALERTLRFETTGTVNGYPVQRARLALRGQSAALFALRDGRGMFQLALFAPDGAVYRHRARADDPWHDSVTTDVGDVAPLLRRNNFLPSWIDLGPRDEHVEAVDVRATFAVPNPHGHVRPLAGEQVVEGMRASAGRAVGLARLGTRGRHPTDLDGGVLFAATMTPNDSVFLYHARAVVATGGGILSHAGLMAVQYGRPALIVSGQWEEHRDGTASFAYRRLEFEQRRRSVGVYEVASRSNVCEYEEQVREGDLVVVDADNERLHVLGQGQLALTLHDALRRFEAATGRLGRATAPADVLAERGRRLHALHQLEKLAARIDEPALVQHAIRELLIGTLAGVTREARVEKARLLGILRERPGAGAFVDEAVLAVARELAERYAVAHGDAVHTLRSARSVHEVLTLRLAVARLGAALADLAAFLATAGVGVPAAVGIDDRLIDALSLERVGALRSALVDSLRRPGAIDLPATRHRLRELGELARVVELSERDRDEIGRCRRDLEVRDAARAGHLANRYVLWPGDGGLETSPMAGMKAANLGELHQVGAGHLVPAWFVVTDRAFQEVLRSPAPRRAGAGPARAASSVTLGEAIDATVSRDDLTPDEKAAQIRQFWADVPLPAPVEREVVDAYRQLDMSDGPVDGGREPVVAPVSDGGARSVALRQAQGDPERSSRRVVPGPDVDLPPGVTPGEPFVAIRSSAREEDTALATGAGEFDTFLFVRGGAGVLAHLRRAWSGLWTARAIHDRAARGSAGRGEGGGIIVQRIAWSRVSGVLQTTNVAEGRTREMVVNVGLGLGEGIVSGLVAADHVVVSKDEDPETEPLRFRYVTADKRERVVFDARSGSGTIRAGVLSHQRLRASLEYTELVELVRAATKLEAAYGYPLDIEFGFEGAQLRILQARPVPGSLAVWRETRERYPLVAPDIAPGTRHQAPSTGSEALLTAPGTRHQAPSTSDRPGAHHDSP